MTNVGATYKSKENDSLDYEMLEELASLLAGNLEILSHIEELGDKELTISVGDFSFNATGVMKPKFKAAMEELLKARVRELYLCLKQS